MVDDGRAPREQPVVRTVSEEHHVGRGRHVGAAEAAPALRDERADVECAQRGEEERCERVGVVDDDGAEADVDRGWAGGEEGGEVGWGCVAGGEGEEGKAADGDLGGPVEGLGDQSGGPDVGVWDCQAGDHARGPHGANWVQAELGFAEAVDEITEAAEN